tara:strand:+ start:30453 stop:31433 length:981 start_codon:yes stop_codon:yes gene_type:complete
MAFQDSCGTIIIDAVLTDIGRQKMAKGEFRVTKFALGDDEVDYTFGEGVGLNYTLNEPALPTLEASSNQGNPIKYGLLSLPRKDIIYIPQFHINEKVTGAAKRTDGRYYVAVNKETTRKLELELAGPEYVIENNSRIRNFIMFETGIHNENLELDQGTSGRERYITNLGLSDGNLFIYCDRRLVDEVLVNSNDSFFKNDTGSNLYMNLLPLRETVKISLTTMFDEQNCYKMKSVPNEIYNDYNQTISVVNGPRGIVGATSIKIKNELINDSESNADARYTTFGTTDSLLFGGSDKYDYIDTSFVIEGASTGMQKIIPIRIIRYSGT